MENRVLKEKCVGVLDKHHKSMGAEEILLEQVLSSYTKERIKDIAKKFKLTKLSALKKADLVEKTAGKMLEPETMENAFIHLRDTEMDAWKRAMLHRDGYDITEEEERLLSRIYGTSYLMYKSDARAFVTADVVSLYNEINTEDFNEKRRIVSWIIDCFTVATRFYGIVPVEVMVNMVNRHRNICIDEESLMDYYEMIPEAFNTFSFSEGMFIHVSLKDVENACEKIMDYQGNRKYYIPNEKEIEEIAVEGYIISDKHVEKLVNFFCDDMNLSQDKIKCILWEMQNHICSGCSINDVYNIINKYQICFESEQQLKRLVPLINEMCNNTRMLKNRGFKPSELIVNTVKVGRNEPCPCGSGKKYKKCCGR